MKERNGASITFIIIVLLPMSKSPSLVRYEQPKIRFGWAFTLKWQIFSQNGFRRRINTKIRRNNTKSAFRREKFVFLLNFNSKFPSKTDLWQLVAH